MCGINCINWKDKKKILSMNKTIAHRGPDQKDIFLDEYVSLGHVRLSILDFIRDGKATYEI